MPLCFDILNSHTGRVTRITEPNRLDSIDQLKTLIYNTLGIPQKKQILLLPDGTEFRFKKGVTEYKLYLFVSGGEYDNNNESTSTTCPSSGDGDQQSLSTTNSIESTMNIITQSSIANELYNSIEKILSCAIEKQNEMDQQNAAMRVAIGNLERHVEHSGTRFDINKSKFERLQHSTNDNLEHCDVQKLRETQVHPTIQRLFGYKYLIDLISHNPEHVQEFVTNLKTTVTHLQNNYSHRQVSLLEIQQKLAEVIEQHPDNKPNHIQSIMDELSHLTREQRNRASTIQKNATNSGKNNEQQLQEILLLHTQLLEEMKQADDRAKQLYKQMLELKKGSTALLYKILGDIALTGRKIVKNLQFSVMDMEIEELEKLVVKLESITKFKTNYDISLLEMERRKQWQDSVLVMIRSVFQDEYEKRKIFKQLVGRYLGKNNSIATLLNRVPRIDEERLLIQLEQFPDLYTIDMEAVLEELGGQKELTRAGLPPTMFHYVPKLTTTSSSSPRDSADALSSSTTSSDDNDNNGRTHLLESSQLLPLANQIEQLIAEKARMERHILQMKRDQERQRDEYLMDEQELKKQIQELNDEKSTLNEAISFLTQQKEETKTTNSSKINTYEIELTRLKNEKINLQQQVAMQTENIEQMRQIQLETLKNTGKLNAEIHQLRVQLEVKANQYNSLEEEKKQMLQLKTEQLERETSLRVDTEQKYQLSLKLISDKQHELSEIRSLLNSQIENLEQSTKSVDSLTHANLLLDNDNKSLSAENSELKHRLNILHTVLHCSVEKLQDMTSWLEMEKAYNDLYQIDVHNQWENLDNVMQEIWMVLGEAVMKKDSQQRRR